MNPEKELLKMGFEQHDGYCWCRDDIPFNVTIGNLGSGDKILFFIGVEVYALGTYNLNGFKKLIEVYEKYNLE